MFLNRRCALVLVLESILLILVVKIVLQHILGGRAEVRDAREATTAIGANAKTLVFASTTNTDHAPEGLSGSLRRTAMTLREDTVQRLPRRPLVGGETVE